MIFCRHEWDEVARIEPPQSVVESIKNLVQLAKTYQQVKLALDELTRFRVSIEYQCFKCGKHYTAQFKLVEK